VVALSACIIALFAIDARAAFVLSPLDPEDSNSDHPLLLLTGDQTAVPAIEAAIENELGLATGTLETLLLYKADEPEDPEEHGPLALSYMTQFVDPPNDPSGATISYEGGDFAIAQYALVKDGAANPAWYFFDVTGWNGTDDLVFEGFWPGQGAISHISLYGTTQEETNGDPPPNGEIPEPASVVVWSLLAAAVGLAAMRRRRAAA
jgi:hypothetical protein